MERIKLYPGASELSTESLVEKEAECWRVGEDQRCCIAPVVMHPNPKRTCGLGDNIAAAALLK